MPDLDHTRYADWDAAYVLGSLSRTERAEYEEHLSSCEICRSAVGELAPIPGLLSRIDPAEALALLDDTAAPAPVIAMSPRRRSWPGRLVAGALAAAAVVAVAVLVPTIGGSPTPAPAATVVLRQTVPSPLSADVSLTRTTWGTRIAMTCTYATTYGGASSTYQLYVLDRSHHAYLVSSWHAGPGDVARTTGSSQLDPAEIAGVQVRDASGSVLLSAQT
ncbi:MAG: zf-HC2 domain-containing protein [Marmoricola sp.]